MNIGQAFTRNRLRNPDGLATWWGDRELTHTELDIRTNQLANLLIDRYGVKKGESVAIFAANRLEVVEVLGGCAKSGAVYVGLNFRMSESDLRGFFTLVQPKVIITAGEFVELAQQLAKEFDAAVLDLDDAGPEGYDAQLLGAAETPSPIIHDILHTDDFTVVPTSGTTGIPEGCALRPRCVAFARCDLADRVRNRRIVAVSVRSSRTTRA